MKNLSPFFMLLFFSFFFLKPVWGQENKPLQIEVEAGYTLNSGNTETEDFYASFETEYLNKKDEFRFSMESHFAKADSETKEENHQANLNYDRVITPKISLFILNEGVKDRFQKIELRYNTGGGGKFTFYKDKGHKISVSGAVLYEYESFTDKTRKKHLARFSIRPKLKFKFHDDLSLSCILFYQPKVDDFNDYRINSKTSLTIHSKSGIGLKVALIHKYDNLPEEAVKSNDTSLITSLLLSF